MREPSDIAVSNREFYVCDFKVRIIFNDWYQFVILLFSRGTMLSCLQRRDILLEGSVARTSQTFPMVSISQVRQHIFEIIFIATVLIYPDAGDILIGDSHGNKFHVVVFANDGSLLGEFECPHVKVGV